MNKPSVLLSVPLFMVLLLSGCSTFQYTSRQVDVARQDLRTEQQLAGLEIDLSQTVTATSDYQVSRKEAIKEAEFRCLQEAKIDVVVDPVFKLEYRPFRAAKRWKATIIGYAGRYKAETKGVVDAVKEYEMEDIEKYKLLTDPTFPQYYYNKEKGDVYNFGTPFSEDTSEAAPASIVLQDTSVEPTIKAPKVYDPFKAKRLRDAGISCSIIGVAILLGATTPCVIAYEKTDNHEAFLTGICLSGPGCGLIAAGIPMWCVGSYRMKHSKDNVNLSLGANAQGMGIKLTF